MLRLLFVAAAAISVFAQNGTQQCGGTTGLPCPSPTAAPTKLPCCVDPARCTAGQQLCPTPSPSPRCCPVGTNCGANITICASPSQNTTAPCCDTADCVAMYGFPICPGMYTPAPYTNTTNCCTTYDCFNKTGLPLCPGSPGNPGMYSPPPTPSSRPMNTTNTTNPGCCNTTSCMAATGLPLCPGVYSPPPTPAASPRASSTPSASAQPIRPSISVSPSASSSPKEAPSMDPVPSPSVAPSTDAQPSADPTKRPQPSSEPSADPTKRPQPSSEPSADFTKRPPSSIEPSADPTKRPQPSSEPSADFTKRPPPSIESSADFTKRPPPSIEPSADPTKRPQPSSAATQRPAPSNDPTRLPTPRPSNAGPSAPPTVRPSRLPAASLAAWAQRSAAPTPRPVRLNSPAPYVPALTSTLRFQNANPAVLNTTQGVQQLTANIACALRMPLENIQIKNITRTIGGQVVIVPYDPTMASLASNGQIMCFGANTTTTPRLLLRMRRRSLTSTDSVNVDYVISDPTPAILSMEMTDFSATLAADPAIIDLAIVLGSSGIEADAPPELAFASAAAGPSPPSAGGSGSDTLSSQNAIPIIVGAVAGAAVVSAFVAGGLFFVLNKSRGSAVTAQKSEGTVYKQSPAVLIIEPTLNPMAAANASNTPSRSVFDPQGVRVGARV